MTVSNTFFFTVVAADLVREMMLNCGAIGEAETPTAQEYNDCLRKVNMIIKQYMGKQDFAPGLKMWTRDRADLFLGYAQNTYQLGPTGDNWAAGVTGGSFNQNYNQTQVTANLSVGTATIPVQTTAGMNIGDFIGVQVGGQIQASDIFWSTIAAIPTSTTVVLSNVLTTVTGSNAYVWNYTVKGQRPLAIETSILRDLFGSDTPQNVLTLQDYELLPNKTQPQYVSDPTSFYYESQIGPTTATSNGVYYIDCAGAQDVTKHLHMVFLQPIMDLVNPTDNLEMPQQWYRAMCWAGTREICGMFDAVWTQDMQASWTEAMTIAREPDPEITSFYFQPNADSPFSP